MSQHSDENDVVYQTMVEFRDRLESLVVSRGDGTQEIDSQALRELVRSDPERIVAACQAYAEVATSGVGKWHGTAQFAYLLALTYQAEFDDDSLTLWLAETFASAGLEVRIPVVRNPSPPEPPKLRVEVSTEMLANRDIYPFVLAFSHHERGTGGSRRDELLARRGRVMWSFDIPLSDPRHVWEVPEVREYMTLLSQRLPYLPYFLDPDPEARSLFVWLACLAPPHAFHGNDLQLVDDDVLVVAAQTRHSVRVLAGALGEDPDEVAAAVFGVLPEAYVEMVDAVIAEAYDDDDS
ncbi:hypothetical protein [Lentzea sp. NPDC051838]|uniref:hypothetical protein n=1 Tax=Lentzea sp. NPDC051838 TaxID=3154849 RepID=UPI00341D9AD9